MKRTISMILLGMFAVVSALAQEGKPAGAMKAKDSMPTVDQILDKYVKAIGGKEAVEKHSSRMTKGTFEIPAMGLSGSTEVFEKAPNKILLVITIPGFGLVQEGFDGAVGWAEDPQSGLREKTGIELAQTKLDWAFYRNTNLKKLYPTMVLKGEEKVGERAAYVIEATPAESGPEKWYFDVENGLLVRMDQERESPMGKLPLEVYLSDYREVDGVKLPFSFRQITPAFTLELKSQEIKHGVAIDDAKFKKPGGQ